MAWKRRKEDCLVKTFFTMIDGLSWRELERLFSLKDEDFANVYVMDPTMARAERPLNGDLLWPVCFLLSKFNRKHVFEASRKPQLSKITHALSQWEHKLRWKLTLAGDNSNPWWKLKAKREARPCPNPVDHSMEHFIQMVKHGITEAAQHIRKKQTPLRTPVCIDFALERLKQGLWGAVFTDKDGGYCLIPKQWLHDRKLRILEGDCYRLLPGLLLTKAEDARIEYANVIKDVPLGTRTSAKHWPHHFPRETVLLTLGCRSQPRHTNLNSSFVPSTRSRGAPSTRQWPG